jgi:hypothetical protein
MAKRSSDREQVLSEKTLDIARQYLDLLRLRVEVEKAEMKQKPRKHASSGRRRYKPKS